MESASPQPRGQVVPAPAPDPALDPWAAWDQAVCPDPGPLAMVQAATGIDAAACFACGKCGNGCPLAAFMDYRPPQVVDLLRHGRLEELAASRTIWLCSSCQTCVTRCPNQVDIPRLMDFLREYVVREGLAPADRHGLLFNRLFLDEVKKRGRVYEVGLMTRYLMQTSGPLSNQAAAQRKLGLRMLRRGRLKFWPARCRDRRWLKGLFAPEGGR